jgi:RNA 3'-terminal phosphate cyclase
LDTDVVPVFSKEHVGSSISGAKSGPGSIGKGFNVYVVFVHGEEEVLGAILGADGESARKVGEVSVAAEIRRMADSASE